MAARGPWHVSAKVDLAVYSFGWIWVLVPLGVLMLPMGAYQGLMLFSLMLDFIHRHWTLLYAYGTSEVRQREKDRLRSGAIALLVGFILLRSLNIALGPSGAWVVKGLFITSVLVTVWHSILQKFGILRFYAARSPWKRLEIPRRLDLMAILAFIPFAILKVMGDELTRVAGRLGGPYAGAAQTVTLGIAGQNRFLLPMAALFGVGVLAAWARQEWKADGLRNRARIAMVGGTNLAMLSIFWVAGLDLVYSLGANHGVEYLVFVSSVSGTGQSGGKGGILSGANGRRNTWILLAALCAIFLGWQSAARSGRADLRMPVDWILDWTVVESFYHFYLDSFLWRLRKPAVAQALGVVMC